MLLFCFTENKEVNRNWLRMPFDTAAVVEKLDTRK